MIDDDHAFAAMNRGGSHGYVMRWRPRPGRRAWDPLTNGLRVAPLSGLTLDWTTTPQVLYASTESDIYRSADEGGTWDVVTSGLPRQPEIKDIEFVAGRRLYEIAGTASPHACSRITARLRCSHVSPSPLNMEPRMALRRSALRAIAA
jgi:hypothetical protein